MAKKKWEAPPAQFAGDSSWEVLRQELVYDGAPYVMVERQTVRLTGGLVVEDYHQVSLPDFAIAVPLLKDGRFLTLWQYKHGARCYSMTFPAGHIESGEDPAVAIRRELREETGYVAETCIGFGAYAVSGNQGCGRCHLFALTGCAPDGSPEHDDLETWDIRLMTMDEVEDAIRSGHCAILPQLAAWLAFRGFPGKVGTLTT